MFRLFYILPFVVCVYEILSLIFPLRVPVWLKGVFSLVLLAGLLKNMLYQRTPSGFDVMELPYPVILAISAVFNFIILALFMTLAKDFLWLLWKIVIRSRFPSGYASGLVLIVGTLSTVYGTYQGLRVPDVHAHEVVIPGLGREFDGLRVAMMVDIHADSLSPRSFVKAITDKVNSLNPDVVLLPGDFVDGQVDSRRGDVEPLKNLRAKFGVFGSTGNHEYYFDFDGWMRELKGLGIRFLENEHVVITSGDSQLVIAGLPDPTGGRMGLTAPDIDAALRDSPENVPVIIMDHQPGEARRNAEHGVALQVSGHTHGGQIPGVYTLVQRANGGFVRGWYEVGNMRLYVSPGTSQWNGFAMRLFDPSEITLFVLKCE